MQKTKVTDRVGTISEICKAVGIKRPRPDYIHFSKRELIHLLAWVLSKKATKDE